MDRPLRPGERASLCQLRLSCEADIAVKPGATARKAQLGMKVDVQRRRGNGKNQIIALQSVTAFIRLGAPHRRRFLGRHRQHVTESPAPSITTLLSRVKVERCWAAGVATGWTKRAEIRMAGARPGCVIAQSYFRRAIFLQRNE